MTDPITGALVSAGATLLGSLNKRSAKTDLEAARLIDQEDPIRKALEAFPKDKAIDARAFFVDGHNARLVRVLEVGYGAARVRLQINTEQVSRGTTHWFLDPDVIAVVRFSAVAMITVVAPK